MKIIEEIELHLDANLESTFVGLRYRPTFTWWDERDEDDTDFHHYLDFILDHSFSPRVSLNVKETLQITQLPELVERGVLREENDFVYNSINASLRYLLKPDTSIDTAGRYVLLRYDDSDLADREDFDLFVIGVTLNHKLKPETSVKGTFRYEDIAYDTDSDSDRSSDSIRVGVGTEHTFNPGLLGNANVGWQHKNFDDADADEKDSPFAYAQLTFLPSPATRISLSVGFSLYEANVDPFASQDRARFTASLAHDLTARIKSFLSSSYIHGLYDGDDRVDGDTTDGDEDLYQLSARATYQLNRSNWLEAGCGSSRISNRICAKTTIVTDCT